MKYLSVLLTWIILLSCGANQNSMAAKQHEFEQVNCPEDGTCTLEVLKNTSLEVKNDNLNALYPELVNGETLVLTFEYERQKIPNVMDGDYREIIYMELDPSNLEIEKNGSELKDVKLLFARLCYCKGQTGYYEITDGHLKISKSNEDTYQLFLEFNTEKVPQILNKISRSFSISTL